MKKLAVVSWTMGWIRERRKTVRRKSKRGALSLDMMVQLGIIGSGEYMHGKG